MSATRAELLFKQARFVAGASTPESIPFSRVPEIGIVGRSNVGKSSLINALTTNGRLARTSQSPGQTRQLNFFALEHKMMLVDMPGYGFAKVSKAAKKEWDALIHTYLTNRPNLKRVLLLIDARRGLLPLDEGYMRLLDEVAVSYQLVFTKTDAVPARDLETVMLAAQKSVGKHAAAHPEIAKTSTHKDEGVDSLRQTLYSLCFN